MLGHHNGNMCILAVHQCFGKNFCLNSIFDYSVCNSVLSPPRLARVSTDGLNHLFEPDLLSFHRISIHFQTSSAISTKANNASTSRLDFCSLYSRNSVCIRVFHFDIRFIRRLRAFFLKCSNIKSSGRFSRNSSSASVRSLLM